MGCIGLNWPIAYLRIVLAPFSETLSILVATLVTVPLAFAVANFLRVLSSSPSSFARKVQRWVIGEAGALLIFLPQVHLVLSIPRLSWLNGELSGLVVASSIQVIGLGLILLSEHLYQA